MRVESGFAAGSGLQNQVLPRIGDRSPAIAPSEIAPDVHVCLPVPHLSAPRADYLTTYHSYSRPHSGFVKKVEAEKLTEILIDFHKAVVIEVTQRRRRAPTKYKSFEPHKIRTFFESYNPSRKPILEIAADVLSTLLRAHPFPNANHRTTLFATEALFKANGLRFPHYEGVTPRWRRRYVADCNRFIPESKYWLKLRRNRDKLGKGARVLQVTKTRMHAINPGDLDLNKGQMAAKHLAMTKEWLIELLGDQSDKYRRVSPEALTRLIAQAER